MSSSFAQNIWDNIVARSFVAFQGRKLKGIENSSHFNIKSLFKVGWIVLRVQWISRRETTNLVRGKRQIDVLSGLV